MQNINTEAIKKEIAEMVAELTDTSKLMFIYHLLKKLG